MIKKLIPVALLAVLVGCNGGNGPDVARKVAVLIAGDVAEIDGEANNTEFWNDTVLTYCMLRKNGFRDEDIYVLYGIGTDGYAEPLNPSLAAGGTLLEPADYYSLASGNGYCDEPDLTSTITDLPVALKLPMTNPDLYVEMPWCEADGAHCWYPVCRQTPNGVWRCPLKHVLDCLSTGCEPSEIKDLFDLADLPSDPIDPLEKDDYLFVWWKGHGTADPTDPESFKFKFHNDFVPYHTVNDWLRQIPVAHRSFVIDVCHSGCLYAIDENKPVKVEDLFGKLGGPDPVILAACQCDQPSWGASSALFADDHLHGPWSFMISCSLRGQVPTFAGGLLGTSGLSPGGPLADSFEQCKDAMDTWYGTTQVPAKRDPELYAPVTRIDIDDPAGFANNQYQQPQGPGS